MRRPTIRILGPYIDCCTKVAAKQNKEAETL